MLNHYTHVNNSILVKLMRNDVSGIQESAVLIIKS